MKNLLIDLLNSDMKKGNLPIEFSREAIDDGEGNDELIMRFKYKSGHTIELPYNSKIYEETMSVFNKLWKKVNSSEKDPHFIEGVYLNY